MNDLTADVVMGFKSADAAGSYPLLSYMKDMCRSKDFEKLNDFINGLDFSEFSILGMITIARGNWPASHLLPDYYNVINKIETELNKRGEDSRHILRGLYINE